MDKQVGVLVVDRDVDVREGLRDVLEVEGYSVASASPGIAARIALATTGPRIVLLGRMGTPRTGLDFVRVVEQERYLLDIALKVIDDSASEEPEVTPMNDATCSGESAVQAARREALEDLIAERRAHQLAVAKKMRRQQVAQLAAVG